MNILDDQIFYNVIFFKLIFFHCYILRLISSQCNVLKLNFLVLCFKIYSNCLQVMQITLITNSINRI